MWPRVVFKNYRDLIASEVKHGGGIACIFGNGDIGDNRTTVRLARG